MLCSTQKRVHFILANRGSGVSAGALHNAAERRFRSRESGRNTNHCSISGSPSMCVQTRSKIRYKVPSEEIIPAVLQLPQIEQEELRQILEKRKPLNWDEEWEKVTTRFHQAFERRPQEEVEADFQKALDEVRRDKNAKMD